MAFISIFRLYSSGGIVFCVFHLSISIPNNPDESGTGIECLRSPLSPPPPSFPSGFSLFLGDKENSSVSSVYRIAGKKLCTIGQLEEEEEEEKGEEEHQLTQQQQQQQPPIQLRQQQQQQQQRQKQEQQQQPEQRRHRHRPTQHQQMPPRQRTLTTKRATQSCLSATASVVSEPLAWAPPDVSPSVGSHDNTSHLKTTAISRRTRWKMAPSKPIRNGKKNCRGNQKSTRQQEFDVFELQIFGSVAILADSGDESTSHCEFDTQECNICVSCIPIDGKKKAERRQSLQLHPSVSLATRPASPSFKQTAMMTRRAEWRDMVDVGHMR